MPIKTPLTYAVLHEYFSANDFIVQLEQEIAAIQQRKFNLLTNKYNTEPRWLNLEIKRVQWMGVQTLEEVVDLLTNKRSEVLAIAERFLTISEVVYIGTSLRYLSYELVALTQDKDKITQFVQECVDNVTFKKLSAQLLKVYA